MTSKQYHAMYVRIPLLEICIGVFGTLSLNWLNEIIGGQILPNFGHILLLNTHVLNRHQTTQTCGLQVSNKGLSISLCVSSS